MLSPRHTVARPPKILLAPLNWGLGHASRCIPIIRTLLESGVEVVLASDGEALDLLRAEFPELTALELPSYRIRYTHHNMVRNMAWQLPRIIRAVRAEHVATERLVQQHGIDGIISDNRYGCFSRNVSSVIMTHQLRVKVNNPALEYAANLVLRKALRQFNEVWTPDLPGEGALSGVLSHPVPPGLPPVRFIGHLSRFQAQPETHTEYDVAVVLSGPEPQRTYLEQILLEQALQMPLKFMFVQGKPKTKTHQFVSENIEMTSFLTSERLEQLMASSRVIVCRSGYSSLMDLKKTGKQALLIPTPGQTEQEYLAAKLHGNGQFMMQQQTAINLQAGLKWLENMPHHTPASRDENLLEAVLEDWLRPK